MKYTKKPNTLKRSIISIVVMLLFVLSPVFGIQAPASADITLKKASSHGVLQKSFRDSYQFYGDVNNDTNINLVDVMLIQRSVAKINSFKNNEKIAADVNGDDVINMSDIVMIQKYIALLRSKFPAGKLFHII